MRPKHLSNNMDANNADISIMWQSSAKIVKAYLLFRVV